MGILKRLILSLVASGSLIGCGGYLAKPMGGSNSSSSSGVMGLNLRAQSSATWLNFGLPALSEPFSLEYDAIPDANNIDAVTALSAQAASTQTLGAVTVRFNPSGFIDALNASQYEAISNVSYHSGIVYHFRLDVDPTKNVYNASVTPDGGIEQIIAVNYAFHNSAGTINYLGIQAAFGQHTIFDANLTLPVATASAPAPMPVPVPKPAPSPAPVSPAPSPTPAPAPSPSAIKAPVTSLHYTANGSFTAANAIGFNVADVGSVDDLNALPAGTHGLVWLGLCNGADANFISAVTPFKGNSKLFGFYLMDEPSVAAGCPAANLKAESDYIHANLPGAKTFIIEENNSDPLHPQYDYYPGNSDLDLYGLDPYPCQPTNVTGYSVNCNYAEVNAAVNEALALGIPRGQIVPVYQAFGGQPEGAGPNGGYSDWYVPTQAETIAMLATWAAVVPNPVFDYAYAWGQQESDYSLSMLGSSNSLGPSYNLQAIYQTLFSQGSSQ